MLILLCVEALLELLALSEVQVLGALQLTLTHTQGSRKRVCMCVQM